jgi:hypothetical protein
MSPEAILAVLSDRKEGAKSMKEIAHDLGLEIFTHTDWLRAERSLARVFRALIKWGWVAGDRRQRVDGHKFWYNAYWKTEIGRQPKPP